MTISFIGLPYPEPDCAPMKTLLVPLHGSLQRERNRIRAVILGVHGLMPLLMKQRNGARWTADERAELSHQLRGLVSVSPYLIVLLLPGSFVLFPIMAWWLDRRRLRRGGSQASASSSAKVSTIRP